MTPQDLQRIDDLGYKFSELSRALAGLDIALDEWTDVKDWLGELKAYKESGQWKEDVGAEERGEIPADIEKVMLLEDELETLFKDAENILMKARGI